jgi:hypothetical protein
MKKERDVPKYVFLLLTLAVLTPVAFAGFFSDSLNFITGFATTTGQTGLNITIGNTAPTIYNVSATNPASPSPTESGQTEVNVTFHANDTDGATNLNDSTASAFFQFSGEPTRNTTSCTALSNVTGDGGSINYTCTVYMEYYDIADDWTINVTIQDINDAEGRNASQTFTYQSTLAHSIGPSNLSWNSLAVTSTNSLASNDPLQINNTANANITSINVTALNLTGESISTEFIYADNFSVNTADACDSGTNMTAHTSVKITAAANATVGRGNNTDGGGLEELFFCLEEIPPTISSQDYSATSGSAWTITSDTN